MAARKRRVLLIAQLAPPSPLVAARRVAGLTKYLARNGFDVTVLTSSISGEGQIEGAGTVVRTGDLMASRMNWRRRSFEALKGESSRAYNKPSRLESALVPDVATATWLPFAAAQIRKLVPGGTYDCIISSAPPQSAHLAGLIGHRRGIPWIADFRDGWTYDQVQRWPFRWQRRLDMALERKVVLAANAVVAVTKPIADDLQNRFGVPVVTITNGFDPDEAIAEEVDGLLDPKRHSLVYTGRLGYSGLTPEPLLEGLQRLRAVDASAAKRLELVIAGPLRDREESAFASPGLVDIVRYLGPLDRETTLRLQREADSLLVITSPQRERSVATGKLFEYLAARKPVVVLGDKSAAAEIVADANAGIATSVSDPDAIAQTLVQVLEGRAPTISEEDAAEFSYETIAERYMHLVNRVCREH